MLLDSTLGHDIDHQCAPGLVHARLTSAIERDLSDLNLITDDM